MILLDIFLNHKFILKHTRLKSSVSLFDPEKKLQNIVSQFFLKHLETTDVKLFGSWIDCRLIG